MPALANALQHRRFKREYMQWEVTRAEMAVFILRAFDQLPKP